MYKCMPRIYRYTLHTHIYTYIHVYSIHTDIHSTAAHVPAPVLLPHPSKFNGHVNLCTGHVNVVRKFRGDIFWF